MGAFLAIFIILCVIPLVFKMMDFFDYHSGFY